MKWRNWLSALIGVWFMIAPWVIGFTYERDATWLSVFVGGLQVLVSIWAAAVVERPNWRVWQNWIAVLTGFWFVVHPFLGHFEEGPYWGIAGPGVATIVLNLWTLMAPARVNGSADTQGPNESDKTPRRGSRPRAGT